MVYEVKYELPERKSLVKRLTEWITPKSIGKFGIGFTVGNKEVFFGVTISSIVFESVIRKGKRKSYKRTSSIRVVDL